jgi:phosphoadenosine phosphosulfate reductase
MRPADLAASFRLNDLTMNLEQLDADIQTAVADIHARLAAYRTAGKTLFATSSFQTQSIPLLHLLSQVDRTIPVYFLNTGYHFAETLAFRDAIVTDLELNLVDLRPLTPKALQRDKEGVLYYASDPDHCCFMNKVQPLEPVLERMDVWVNGIRATQSAQRRRMQVEEPTPQGAVRYHPMLDWTDPMIHRYAHLHQLPSHPLDAAGYVSVGCEPCTRRHDAGAAREERWFGLNKTECGLHVDLVGRK